MFSKGFMRTAIVSALAFAAPAFANVVTSSQQDNQVEPNVIVVKSPLDKDGQPIQKGSELYAVSVQLQQGQTANQPDINKLVTDANGAMQQAQAMPIQQANLQDNSIPAPVKQLLQQQQSTQELNRRHGWGYWNPRYNIYGYWNYPYYGYYANYGYPYYGYYNAYTSPYFYNYNYAYYNSSWPYGYTYYYYW